MPGAWSMVGHTQVKNQSEMADKPYVTKRLDEGKLVWLWLPDQSKVILGLFFSFSVKNKNKSHNNVVKLILTSVPKDL